MCEFQFGYLKMSPTHLDNLSLHGIVLIGSSEDNQQDNLISLQQELTGNKCYSQAMKTKTME